MTVTKNVQNICICIKIWSIIPTIKTSLDNNFINLPSFVAIWKIGRTDGTTLKTWSMLNTNGASIRLDSSIIIPAKGFRPTVSIIS